MIFGSKRDRIKDLKVGSGFWLPIKIGEGMTLNCLYVKQSKTSFDNQGPRPVLAYECLLVRVVLTSKSLVLFDRCFDGHNPADCILYHRDCEVSCVT